MTFWKSVVLSTIVFAAFSFVRPAHSQVSVGVNIGAAPVCPYGYFDYEPYDCAPYGYNGPLPGRGSEAFNHFQANEARDGRGHAVAAPSHNGGGERGLPGYRGGG